jgi:hypothetical protein
MEYIVIFLIICFIIIWVFALIVFKNCRVEFCLGSIIAEIIIAYISILIDMSKPTALDVYRGKTTLEVTSINGVPQDTVVVFKKYK